ncbi:MAG TPA: sigma-70 family RNA polymerase sigma factor [Polyangiales bacterium]|nr:sigma-70 family RNA polymerase sigma factor [Polyangiales bacterium]
MDIDGWYRRYGESVFRRCLRLCRDQTRASDLTQEVFLRAHRYRDSFRGDSSPMTWLFTLADRCFFDAVGKLRPPPTAAEVAVFLHAERDGVDEVFEQHDLVVRLLARTPEDVRAIVLHRYFDELDLASIAERLGINERTVRRKLERFLAQAERLAKEQS